MNTNIPPLRHYGGFVLAGICALTTDAAILELLRHGFGLNPLLARVPSIGGAMVVSWLINRTITFAAATPPTLKEFAKFAGVSWLSQAVNYSVYAIVLLANPGLWPVLALVAASLVSMFVSYAGFRFGVFRSK
ncbi:MAG TPA: GtrA family protein [Hyphomicrobiaceae bacterium]|nr:GtrA family protein [Hyphomicrobiaceae bacterium]